MNFQELLAKMQELDRPATEACGDSPMPMGMPGMPPMPEKPDTPPPSMSLNLNAQGMDNIEELMKLMTKVNPDMINQPAPMSSISIEPMDKPMGGLPPLKMLPDMDSEPDTDNMPPMGDLDRDDSDDVSKAMGDIDSDGDHDMDDHDMEKKDKVDEYDNTPADPNDKDEFDANAHAHQENQPGQGDRMDGDRPKAYADMNEAVTDLFAQYKKFVSEN